MISNITQRFIVDNESKFPHQGDVLRDLNYVTAGHYSSSTKKIDLIKINLQYAVIGNQECDLQQYNDKIKKNAKGVINTDEKGQKDKYIPNIILFPAYLQEPFRTGDHLSPSGSQPWNSEKWREITKNKNDRFHFIASDVRFQIQDLVIDFKHIYTIKTEYFLESYSGWYLASMNELFREHLSQRFCNYLSRIGLPEIG